MKAKIFHFDYQTPPRIDAEDILSKGLNANAQQKKKMTPVISFGIFIKDEEGKIHGGLSGYVLYGCCHIDMLWMHHNIRGQGWGKKLLQESDLIGLRHACSFSTVNIHK